MQVAYVLTERRSCVSETGRVCAATDRHRGAILSQGCGTGVGADYCLAAKSEPALMYLYDRDGGCAPLPMLVMGGDAPPPSMTASYRRGTSMLRVKLEVKPTMRWATVVNSASFSGMLEETKLGVREMGCVLWPAGADLAAIGGKLTCCVVVGIAREVLPDNETRVSEDGPNDWSREVKDDKDITQTFGSTK